MIGMRTFQRRLEGMWIRDSERRTMKIFVAILVSLDPLKSKNLYKMPSMEKENSHGKKFHHINDN
ncbi:hypothetical protein CDAR_591991, partial [Caerostris darwini]